MPRILLVDDDASEGLRLRRELERAIDEALPVSEDRFGGQDR